MEFEHFGNPDVSRKAGNIGMAMLFDGFALERKTRVQQPPKCERTLALKNRAERENCQVH
ncbi:MAG: hypothetical protein PHV58_02385 [Candidatus Omnitrophica bacterium]|jgi:hypothetical protein|nr:hypothetical protein [Candidatus Omnitrophota bacterium]